MKYWMFAVVFILVMLIPPVIQTYKVLFNFQSLQMVSTLKLEDYTYKDSYLITPKMAHWILMNMEYPYDFCKSHSALFDCNISKIAWVSASIGIIAKDAEYRVYEQLNLLVNKGYDINEYFVGYTSLQGAILSKDAELVSYLLDHGADPCITIKSKQSAGNGLNSFEYLDLLISYGTVSYADITEVFNNKLSNSTLCT